MTDPLAASHFTDSSNVHKWTLLVLATGAFLIVLDATAVSAAALSLTLTLFRSDRERAAATSVFAFVSNGGGALALLLGGSLTSALNWRWV